MSRWFRAYEDALNDPKIQRLPGERFKVWFNLLCVASANKGTLPPLCDLSFSLRMPEDVLRGHIGALQADGLIDTDQETLALSPHNWKGRQFQSDASTERVKRFRNGQRNGDETADETAPETEQNTDTEQKEITAAKAAADFSIRIERDRKKLVEERAKLHLLGCDWNSMAKDLGLAQIEEIVAGSPREISALARIREDRDFPRAFTKIRGSPFLRGEKGSTPCTFDWIVKPANFQKIIEGNYDEIRKAPIQQHVYSGQQR